MSTAVRSLPAPEHPGLAVAEGQKRWLRGLYTELAREAGASEFRVLADALAMLHEGAVVARNTTGVLDAALTARTVADTLLTAHGVPR